MLKKLLSLLFLAVPLQASELDKIFEKEWQKNNITASEEISKEKWMRRIYLDLFGRLPTVDEINFTKDRSKNELITQMLDRKEYGANFADVWKVILVGRRPDRFNNTVINNDAFEDWLALKFNNNIPWNKLVYDLISAEGDNLGNPATNFLLSKIEFRGAGKNEVVRATADTTKIFLGLQIQCSQCHDGKTNDWTQEQFWNTAAFFQGSVSKQIDDGTGKDKNQQNLFELKETRIKNSIKYEIGSSKTYKETNAKYLTGEELQEIEKKDRREALAKFITDPYKEQLARSFVNRYWKYFMGKGFVNPVDDLDADYNPAEFPEPLEYLTQKFIDSEFDIKWLIKQIVLSKPYQLDSTNNGDDSYFSHFYVKPMTPEQIYRTFTMITTRELNKNAQRGFVRLFSGDDDSTESYELTIQQVLATMNGPMTKGILRATKGDIDNIYLSLLSRLPNDDEKKMISDMGVKPEDVAWALLNTNEFILNN